MLVNLKTKNLDFYFNLADRVVFDLKNLAQRSECYGEIVQTKKRKSHSTWAGKHRSSSENYPRTSESIHWLTISRLANDIRTEFNRHSH